MRGTEFAELVAFVAIAERASFARAADHLGVSRSTLSLDLRALEERVGARLLHRTTRSVALTEAGERLLARVRPALGELSEAEREVKALGGAPAGTLRIVMLPPAAQLIVGPLAARFLAAHPGIRLELSVSKAPADLVREGFDAGIRPGEQIERDMISIRLTGELEFGAFASPAYLARHGTPATPRDLCDHDCIRALLPDGSVFGWEFAKSGKRIQVAVGGRFVTDDIGLALRAARDGIGIAYGLRAFHADDFATGRLVRVLDDWSPRLSGYFLYHSSRRQMTPSLRAFIDFLKAEVQVPASPSRGRGRRAPRPRHRLVR
jgi:DNA-binding transcriptional LysR family regulator